MRKIAIFATAAAAILASPAMAANEGPYVGAGVTHDNVASGGDIEGVGFNGFGATAFAGYKIPVSESAYAAVEANFDLMSAKVDVDGTYAKASHGFGVSTLLGYNLNDSTALYGRVGFQRGQMTANLLDDTAVSESRSGLRFGAGLETKLTDTVALRAEYSRTHYYPTAEDKAFADPLTVGINNDQFAFAVVYGF